VDPLRSPAAGLIARGAGATPPRVGRDGRLCLRFARRGERTVLAHSAYTVPLQVLAPVRLQDPAAVVSILNPTGGLLGGDRLAIEVAVGRDAHACVITPSATRVARSDGPSAECDVSLRVDAGGCLEWLPDHAIPSAGAAFRQRIDVDLAPGARLILVDGFAAGRVARGEAWRFARLESALTVREGHRWIFHDRFALDPHGPWAAAGCAEGHPYFASAFMAGAGDVVALARAISAALGTLGVKGAAAPGPRGGLVARVLAASAPALVGALDSLAALGRRHVLDLPPLSRRRV
jgi:urease accessory protein